MSNVVITTTQAPPAVGPYAQAVRAGGLIFCSCQLGLDPASGLLAAGGVVAEAVRAMNNLRAVLEAAGATLADVARTTVYLADLADFPAVNQAYAAFFTGAPPARATIQAGLPKGARFGIDAIACVSPGQPSAPSQPHAKGN